MACQVVWSAPAEKDRKTILIYWINRNRSSTYSAELHGLFQGAIRTISNNPFVGRPTDLDGIRVKSIGDYLLFYEVLADVIIIHHIWDGRRDLKKLKF